MSINIKIPLLALSLFSLISCATGRKPNSIFHMQPLHTFDKAPLIGVIYTTNNKPCSEATLKIFSPNEEGKIARRPDNVVQTDINGRFMIPEVKKGRHELHITKEGYEDGRIVFDFLDMTKVFYIQMISLETLLDEAEIFLEKRQFNQADDRISRALIIDERSVEALYLRAVYYSLNDNPEMIQETMDRIREINPDL